MLQFMHRLRRAPVLLGLVLAILVSTFGAPPPAQAENLHRTVGGMAGLAAGSIGGAALASVVLGAAGVAAWGPLATAVIGASITAAGGFLGAKLFSAGGLALDRTLGPDATWMMVGAMAGTFAAIALLPATGVFAGAAGLVAKGVIGGVVGGTLGKLLAPTLESVATPRNLYGVMGGLVGGLGFGIPGAVAGAVGGYALGGIFGDHFFADEDRGGYSGHRPWDHSPRSSLGEKIQEWKATLSDWFSGRDQPDRSGWDQDPWIQQDHWHGTYSYYDPSQAVWGSYSADPRVGWHYGSTPQAARSQGWNRTGDVRSAKRAFDDASRRFQELNSRAGSHQERFQALEDLRRAEAHYRGLVRGGWE